MSDSWQDQRHLAAHYAIHGRDPGEPEPKPARILVTGPRALTDAALVVGALKTTVAEFGPATVVVHGGARGADTLADAAARSLGIEPEIVEARWADPCRPECRHGPRKRRRDGSTYCPAAGDYRNQEMVDRGADLLLAFLVPRAVSPCNGTRDCARRAKSAGIPVRWFTQEAPC